jgi:hypothetical protein
VFSLVNEIDDSPALLPTLQALQRQLSKLAAAQAAAKQDGQDRSIALSCKSLSIGCLPERGRLARCKPVTQTRAELAFGSYPDRRTPAEIWAPPGVDAHPSLDRPVSEVKFRLISFGVLRI